MISPPSLKPGDTIAIITPARKISEPELETAFQWFHSRGLKVKTGPHLYGSHFQFSGTDAERTSDMQQMLDDPEVKAIFAARGGYGTLRIIDQLDFTAFCQNPKWIVGFSDVTVLHSHIQGLFGIETLHAAMPFTFPAPGVDTEVMDTLWKALSGQDLTYEIHPHPLSKAGTCKGLLAGGNLSILYALSGSVSDLDTDGKVLFLEDLDEYLYHIDRMMQNLKRAGKLSNLSGLIIGGMTKMNDNAVPFGKTAEQIIAEIVAEYNYPVCFGFPAGHMDDNRALILGRTVYMTITGASARLEFESSEPQ